MDRKFLNVLILGFGFMFLFTSFQTMGNIEKTILDNIHKEDPTFTGDGYTSLAVIYTVFSLCNWLAPSFLSYSGPRGAMLIGSVTYCLFMVSFLWPKTWLLYLFSVILGAGASITWTGQGAYLSRCSEPLTISRNSGIFWAMLQCSMFFGNLFVYFMFQDNNINRDTRNLVIGVLIAIAILGCIFLSLLRSMPDNSCINAMNDEQQQQQQQSTIVQKNGIDSAIDAFKLAKNLFFTRDMLLLSVTFLYTGAELSFFSGVYGSSIGFTQKIADNPKRIVGLAGICIGVGEVIGGGLFGILGSRTTRYGRDPIIIVGYIIHIISFFLIFVNLPNNSPFKDTNDISYINPPQSWIALLCAFALGFGDACFNTQIYSMLGGVFVKNSIGAFALFKFTQSVAAAISFFYSSHLGLRVQLGILIVLGTLGTGCFCIVEWSNKRLANRQVEEDHLQNDTKVVSDDSGSSN